MKTEAEKEAEQAKALMVESQELMDILQALEVKTKMILYAIQGD